MWLGWFLAFVLFFVFISMLLSKNEELEQLRRKYHDQEQLYLEEQTRLKGLLQVSDQKRARLDQDMQSAQHTITAQKELLSFVKQITSLRFDNPEMFRALTLIKQGKNVFIHGKAGTGKSFLINHYLKLLLSHTAYVSFTNMAALNIKGLTIHRLLAADIHSINRNIKYWPDTKRQEACHNLRHIKTLVIDEISMVHRSLFTNLDKRLREIKDTQLPFGGLQLVLIGDLYQLPPVEDKEERKSTRYVFCAPVYKELALHFVELTKVYRQVDPVFEKALSAIRAGTDDLQQAVDYLNNHATHEVLTDGPHFYPTRKEVAAKNAQELVSLPPQNPFVSQAKYAPKSRWRDNDADTRLPAPEMLELKPNAPIIFLANNAPFYVNSDIGKVAAIRADEARRIMSVDVYNARTGQIVSLQPYTWYQSKINHNGETEEDKSVWYRQFPIQLAYALTIHKAQGLTLDRACIDFGKGTFETGQAYTALSRVKTVEGLYLEKNIKAGDIKIAPEVQQFLQQQNRAF